MNSQYRNLPQDLMLTLAPVAGSRPAAANVANTAVAGSPRPAVPALGQLWLEQGGIYAGVMRGENGAPNYHLIVCADAAGQAKDVQFGPYGHDEPSAMSKADGLANTLVLVASAQEHPAAKAFAGKEIAGFCDWYLPAQRELSLCWATVPEAFDAECYWSSTQYSPNGAWCQNFAGGNQGISGKDLQLRARAVRRFLIT